MSISFAESLSMSQNQKLASERSVAPMSRSTAVEVVYASSDWQKVSNLGYEFYTEYSDDNMSTVDADKNITLHQKQINITQETNSQYIPFTMSRYYDGYDLSKAKLQFYFVNREGMYGIDYPVDVYCNDEKLRFAWLVDQNVTMLDGKVMFEIQAIGQNSKGETYIWKTRPNSSMNIIESLAGTTFIQPDESWQEDFMTKVNNAVIEANQAAADARSYVNTVKSYSDAASASAATARQIVDDLDANLEQRIEDIYGDTVGDLVSEKMQDALSSYHTKDEVEELINNIDISDQLEEVKLQIENMDGLANFNVEYDGSTMTFYNGESVMNEININSDPSDEWVDAYNTNVDEKINSVRSELNDIAQDVSDNFYKKDDTYSSDEIDTLMGGVASITYVDTKYGELSSKASENAGSISSLNKTVEEINQTISGIDKSPRVTYDATYGDVELDDGTIAEDMFTFWKTENGVREVQDRFQIQGGSGGSGSSVVLRIAYVDGYTTPIVSTVDDRAIVKYNFSGEDSAGDTNLDGTASWKVGNRVVATQTVETGEREFDLTDYLTVGDNKVVLTITHATGAVATKAWTVKIVDVRIESKFDDTRTYTANSAVPFTFTPYGGVAKTVHFLLDGEEIATKNSSAAAAGLSDSFQIPAQPHGTHLFEVYMTADINGKTVESNHIISDVIWYDTNAGAPVIGCEQQKINIRQYESVNITYTVYDPTTETPSVLLSAYYQGDDGETVNEYSSNVIMSSNTEIWQYKTSVIGLHTLTITCSDTVKTISVNVTELGIEVNPVTTGLVFDFNPVGRSNGDANRTWTYGEIAMSVSDNFDWVNGGYQIDENGDQYFCIKSGTSAEISYELFGDDAKTSGKEFKLIFRTKNVSDSEAVFLSCLSDTIGTDKIGIEMRAHEATIYAKTDKLPLPYSEDEIIEFEFNISSKDEIPSMVMGYEDGVSTRPLVYDNTHDFQQYQGYRKTISLGSNDCDLCIYRFKVYNASLSARDILNNFIADARSAEEMIARHDRNQIYKEGILDPDYLAEVCPKLRIIKLEVPHFTMDKDDKVYDAKIPTVIESVFKGGDPIYDNWVAYDCVHSGQGTSSNNYGPSGRNLDLIMKSYKDYGNNPYIVLGDGSRVNKVSLTRESIPVNYFNVKVNIASSENANNALLQRRYNTYNPYSRPFVREDESIIPYIKDTMEFQNCVIFVKESDPDLTTHVEFADCNWHFYAIGNIGDSKKTDSTRLTDPSDPYECILEVMDNTLPNSTMPTGVVDDDGMPVYPILPSQWAPGNPAYDSLYADKFDEKEGKDKDNGLDDTYGWRYIYEDGTDEENAQHRAYVENAWRDFYTFVVTSTDEEFKAHLGDYCVLDSVLFFYLFTLRYTMTDNHAKNSFWHYGKSNDLDSDGNNIRKWDLSFDYDNDTCLGIDNYGRMTYRYGYEEIDYVDGTSDWVWNAPNHVFFLRIRELFDEELCALYARLETAGAWSSTSLINQFNEFQAEFPEELWRIDIERKYIRTYTTSFIDGKAYPEFLTERANGRKKTQRSQFERNQEKYIASKFGGTVASADDIIMRCSVPNTTLAVAPNFDMHLIPYSYIYINVKYNTAPPIRVRAVPNQEYTIEYTGGLADIIEIYSASCLKSVGDLSACYLTNGTFANAVKIRDLVLGNNTDGYNNTNVMTLGLGSNELLNKLNIQNMSGLTHSLDLSGLKNLEELYAFGSSVGGVTFADGGNIEIAQIPDVGTLEMKNLDNLTDDGFESASCYSLSKLVVENSKLDLIDLISKSPNLRQVRLIGINWELENTDILERMYGLAGVSNTGANLERSILAGTVYVPSIKQHQLDEYRAAWPELEIVPSAIVEQFAVTFKNEDGTVLEVQYVDIGLDAIDPTTRTENRIVPTKASTVSHDFTFSAWDSSLNSVFSDRTITAVFTSSLREYTIKYVSRNTVIQETVAKYGDYVSYIGTDPVYTAEEADAYVYHLFSRWDKSGIVDGDKTINAVFDRFAYTDGAFDGKTLQDMRPVEIYALTKLGMANTVLKDQMPYTLTLGSDVDFDDVQSDVIISERTTFTGSNHLDTGIALFDEDRDFVLAIDYEFLDGNSNNAVLAQCFQSNGSNGFKLWYSGGSTSKVGKFTWGSSSDDLVAANKREMVVVRHIKGENSLTIYKSNIDGDGVSSVVLDRTKTTYGDCTLVFGCAKPEEGFYEDHAIGNINWCKLWYADLGDDVCKELAVWTHERIGMKVCGFRKYYLTDNPSQRCAFSLLATTLLDRTHGWSAPGVNSNSGGWANSPLNELLNTRLYAAIPRQIRALIKKVNIPSSVGGKSTEISYSGCYIALPACIELNPTMTSEPYVNEGTTISYLTNDESRKCAYEDGVYAKYWTRSPNVSGTNYVWCVKEDGTLYGFTLPYNEAAVLIQVSM